MVFAGTTLPLYAVLQFMTNKIEHVIALLINHHFICYRYIHTFVYTYIYMYINKYIQLKILYITVGGLA